MFSPLSVGLSVCLLATLRKKTDFHEILIIGGTCWTIKFIIKEFWVTPLSIGLIHWQRLTDECSSEQVFIGYSNVTTQRIHGVIITSLLRQNDVARSFWRNDDVIITSCVRCDKFDGLVQERRNYIVNALELRLSCINPSNCRYQTITWTNMDHLSEMSRNKYDAEFNEYHSRNVIGSDVSNYRKKSCLKLWNFSVFDMVPPGGL